jgi:acetolactate synthase-1/2/3 large subunit
MLPKIVKQGFLPLVSKTKPVQKESGATILFNTLKKYTNLVVGYPGGAILPVLDKFHNQTDIKYILCRTEAGGAMMAEGYAKATNRLGCFMTTSGPGALNTITSLQNALSDGTPILALTGQVATTVLGTDAFQEADVVQISKPVTKWNYIIKDGAYIKSALDTAITTIFSGRYGPVLLDLPKNIMSSDAPPQADLPKQTQTKAQPAATITPAHIIEAIMCAERPLILAGQGVLQSGPDAIKALRALSQTYSIPVTTTLMGLGVVDEKDSLSLKMVGMHGSYTANKAVQTSDLLINFGSRFDDRIIGKPSAFAPNAKIIHVDISARNINKVIKTPNYINSDCGLVLDALHTIKPTYYQQHHRPDIRPWLYQLNIWRRAHPFTYPQNKPALQGREALSVLNTLINRPNNQTHTTIVADVGAHQMWAAQHIDYNYDKVRFITSGGLGTMGYAVPAAIGAKLGTPNRQVICVCGDGGFTMSMIEILTAIEYNIPVKIIVINNSYQMMVKLWQDKFHSKHHVGVKMNNPEFHSVVQAMGAKAIEIRDKDTLQLQLEYFLNYSDGPIVANIITDSHEAVLPMVSPGKPLDDMILEDQEDQQLSGEAPC